MTKERLPLQKVMVSLPSVRHNFGSYMTKNVTKTKKPRRFPRFQAMVAPSGIDPLT